MEGKYCVACNDPSAKASDLSNGVEKWLENVVPINCNFLSHPTRKWSFLKWERDVTVEKKESKVIV